MSKIPLSIPCINYSLSADWYASEKADKAMLVLMGYSSSKERNADFVAEIAKQSNISVLAIDLSGHGESPFALDDITPAQHVLETIAAFDWLHTTYPDASLSVMGTSYGGYMAAWLSRFRNFEKLILRTPAIYKPADFYSPHAKIEKAQQLAKYRSDKDQVAHNPLFQQNAVFDGKTLLIIHGRDEDIPAATSDTYKTAYNAETYVAKDFVHSYRDPRNLPEDVIPYKQAIVSWLK